MSKKTKIIVMTVSCISLVVGTLTVSTIKNKYENTAEVSLQEEIPSTKIDKSNKKNNEFVKKEDKTDSKSEEDKADIETKSKDDVKSDNKANEEVVILDNTTKNDVVDNVVSENNNTSGDDYVKPTPPPVTDKPPVEVEKPTPPPTPPTPPPVIETPEIPEVTFPTVEELKQFMINYGIGLGKTYDPNLDGNGIKRYYFTETWSPWIGQEGGANQLFGGFQYNTFGITVIDQGSGWVEFAIYVSENEYFG
ncbi:MAG: hypothetical protein ACRC68_09720 [Clostridium sp.]